MIFSLRPPRLGLARNPLPQPEAQPDHGLRRSPPRPIAIQLVGQADYTRLRMKKNIQRSAGTMALLLLAYTAAAGQCPITVMPPAGAGQPALQPPQFYDQPGFTVAGVADATNLGGHGSDVVVRTRESLARDTAALAPQDPGAAPGPSSSENVPELERLVAQHPQDLSAAYALAAAYLRGGQYEQARSRLLALLAAAPGRADAHRLLAEVEEKRNHPLDAVREYQRAAELDPSERNLFDWGTELLAHRAADAAVEVFLRGNRLYPDSSRMLVALGVALHARGSLDQATDCLCRAADLHPADPSPYLFLARMQSPASAPSAAILDRLERFARLHPENALAGYYYAAALWKGAQGSSNAVARGRVLALLQEAVRLDPSLGPAYLLQGVVHADAGDYSPAIVAFRQAVAASPQLDEPHYRLAQVYRRMGDKAQAQRELQLYQELSKKAAAEAERRRLQIPQFVVALRETRPAPKNDKP